MLIKLSTAITWDGGRCDRYVHGWIYSRHINFNKTKYECPFNVFTHFPCVMYHTLVPLSGNFTWLITSVNFKRWEDKRSEHPKIRTTVVTPVRALASPDTIQGRVSLFLCLNKLTAPILPTSPPTCRCWSRDHYIRESWLSRIHRDWTNDQWDEKWSVDDVHDDHSSEYNRRQC